MEPERLRITYNLRYHHVEHKVLLKQEFHVTAVIWLALREFTESGTRVCTIIRWLPSLRRTLHRTFPIIILDTGLCAGTHILLR